MTSTTARLRQSGSLVAGLLIGISIVAVTLAVADAVSAAWQVFLFFAAPAVFVLGIAFQVMATAEPRRRLATGAERTDFPHQLVPLIAAR
jgi:formate/nitrite transporter FocA (FNT family)